MSIVKLLRVSGAAALALALAACGARPAVQAPVGCIVDPPAGIGGDIALSDEQGAPVTQAAFAGRPALVYFGFTFCPDVCPLAMQSETLALQALGQEGASVQPILISLDPERDTPAAMARYVRSGGFPEGLRGLTGTPEQTAEAAKRFRVGWRKSSEEADYTLDHTSFFYLMDERWRLRALYPSDLPPQDAAACIKAGLA